MGKAWLLKEVGRGVISPLSFTDNSIVRYLGQACLGKATDVGEEGRATVN